MRALKKQVSEAETRMGLLQKQLSAFDAALIDPASAPKDLAQLNMGELSRRRATVADELEEAEAAWLDASEALEMAQAGG